MKQIFDSYLENAFNGRFQCELKIAQFKHNYTRFLPDKKELPVLDIGIGRGEMLTCMKEWGFTNYHGIDISPSIIKFCKELGLNCTLVEDSAKFLDSHKKEFSLITLLDVLEHFQKQNALELLSTVRESLREDGSVIIQVPNLQAPDGQLHRYNDFTHEIGFIEHSLRQVLSATGYNVVAIIGFEEIIGQNTRSKAWRFTRRRYHNIVRCLRRLNHNLSPHILLMCEIL